jgi:alkanesulfonate monooxygenase SsuD/methylene tetrahydromethanopterin reductase-like flavin-dependent oxidoreductase (luciferase family)
MLPTGHAPVRPGLAPLEAQAPADSQRTSPDGEETNVTKLGVVFTADRPPEELAVFATAAEAAGFDELWLWEDCFLAGGIATSATALAATTRITVGLGVMPAVFRNPVAAAMEVATLARLHPGRFVAGLGHGVPAWMDQVGALPAKPVPVLEETAVSIRRLLDGERFSMEGDGVNLRDVCLEQPPALRPPVVLGVRRPLGLRASGRSADGTILAEPSAPAYIRWARRRIEEGRAAAGRTDPHRLTVFVKGRIDPDRSHARRVVAGLLLSESVAAQLALLDRETELAGLRALRDPQMVAARIPDDLLDQLTASGTAEQSVASLLAIAATGVDSIVVAPIGPDPGEQLRLLAAAVPPDLRG